MADSRAFLPKLDEFIPDYYAPVPQLAQPEAPAAPAAPGALYDALTPAQKKQVDLKLAPRGALSEIGTSFARGATYDLPRLIGQGLKSTGQPGDMLYDAGQGLNDAVEGNNVRFAEDQNPGAHNVVTRALSTAANMLPAVGAVAASALLAPETGGASLAIPAAAGAALFGPSSYQDEYEKALAAGKSPEEAHQLGLQVGALQGVGQAAGGAIAGSLVRGAGRFIGKASVPEALEAIREPEFLKALGKHIATGTAEQVPLQAGVAATQAGIEQAHDIGSETPWEAASASLGPTLALSGVLGAFGGRGIARQMNRNKLLLDTVEKGEAPLPDVDRAAAAVQAQIEPMVGRDAAAEWRMQALQDANSKAAGTWEQQEHTELDAQTQAQQALAAQAPAPSQLGVAAGAPHYPGGPIEAELTWQKLLTQRDAMEAGAQRDAATRTIIANPPPGALSFADYAKQARTQPKEALKLPGGKVTQEGLKDGYLSYLRELSSRPPEEPGRPEGQGELPLTRASEIPAVQPEPFKLAASGTERASPTEVEKGLALPTDHLDAEQHGQESLPLKQDLGLREPAPLSAMELAMRKAQETKRRSGLDTAQDTKAATEGAAKESDFDRLQRVGRASALADAALDGKITGNTPVAHSDLLSAWKRAATEAGIDVSALRGQALARVQQAIGTARGKPLWMQQITALRKARDAMKAGTVSRDSMDALVTKLENFNGLPPETTAAHAPEVGAGAESRPAAGQAAAENAPAAQGRDEGHAQAQRNDESHAQGSVGAARVGEQPAGRVAERENGDRGRPATEAGGGDRTEQRPAQQREGAAETAGPVGQRAAREQRAGETRYAFEAHLYDPNAPRGSSRNVDWVQSYQDAKNDAARVDEHGRALKDSPRTRERAAYAKQALAELEKTEREGEDVHAAAERRYAELQRINELNDRMQTTIRAEMDKAKAQIRRELEQKGLKGVRLEQQLAEEYVKYLADDPNMDFLQTQEPNLRFDPKLADALKTGSVDAVLTHLAKNGPTEFIRDMASLLQSLGLKTSIEATGKVGADRKGGRKYGNYNHTQNHVQIHLGGENAQTVLHELTHAATVGKIKEARAAELVPAKQRTIAQRAAVANLRELRRLRQESLKAGLPIKNVEEFVAEALTNERFHRWLQGKQDERTGRSLWRGVVEWVKDTLGARGNFAWENALERSLAGAFNFLGDSRFGAVRAGTRTPAESFNMTDGVLRTLIGKHEQALNDTKLDIGGKLRKGWMYAATTYHIQKIIEKSPALRTLVPGMEAYRDAHDQAEQLRTAKTTEFNEVLKPFDHALAGLSRRERDAANAKVMDLLGEQSRFNVDLTKNFDQNRALMPDLDPAARDHINALHDQYRNLDPTYKEVMGAAVRVNRKNYIQQAAVTLATTLRAYENKASSAVVRPLLAKLDIMDKTLAAGANPRADFYHDAYSANLHARFNDVVKQVAAAQQGTHLGHAVAEIRDRFNEAVANPYQHLGRSGDFFTSFTLNQDPRSLATLQKLLDPFNKVIGPPGANRHVFLRFENQSQMQAAYRALKDANIHESDTLEGGSITGKDALGRMVGVPRFIQNVMREMADQNFATDQADEVRQFLTRMFLDALPDSSARKALKQRSGGGVVGYDADFMRNFADRAQGMTSMLTSAYAMPKIDEALGQMRDQVSKLAAGSPEAQVQASDVHAELSKRFANSINPVRSPLADRAKAFGFNFYLAFSPAFWLTNMMQPWHLTLPTLGGRYGYVKTAKEMGLASAKAMRIIRATLETGATEGNQLGGLRGAAHGVLDQALQFDKAGLSAGEQEFVQRLLASGQLQTTQGVQLGQMSAGGPRWMVTANRLMSSGAHYTEVLNRLTAGLAGYNLEMKRSGDAEKAHSRGINDSVRGTQYDYSEHNTARALGRHGVAGELTPLLASFQQYSLQTLEMLTRTVRDATFRVPEGASEELKAQISEDRGAAQKALLGLLGTTSVIAGTLGLPLASVVTALMNKLGGNSDDPADVQVAYREWLASWAGKDVAEAIARGVPRAVLGFDTSQRAGLSDVLPGSRFIADRRALKDQISDGAFGMLGPAVSAGKDVMLGLQQVMDGQVLDGLITGLPLALRGPAKAVRMDQQGYTNATGNKLPLEVTPWDEVVQSLGFTPSKKAEQGDVNFAFKQRDQLLLREKGKIANNAYQEIEQQGALSADTLKTVQDWNAKNPQYHVNLQSGLAARARARGVAEVSGTDIETLPRYLPLLDRYSYANVK